MNRPVNSSSLARPWPMIRGRIAQAPMSAPESPTRTNRKATLLRAVPKRRSAAIAMIAPAPAQMPSMAAMIGCGQARIVFTRSPVMRVKARISSVRPASRARTSGPMMSWTSPPEQKLPPAPVMTTARTAGACCSWRKVVRNSSYISSVSGFFRSGRSSVIVATRSLTCQRKWTGLMSVVMRCSCRAVGGRARGAGCARAVPCR